MSTLTIAIWGYLAIAGVFFALEVGIGCGLVSRRLQFSLRALLIATTLIAVGLGVAVIMLRGS
jgi:hypothetical protein